METVIDEGRLGDWPPLEDYGEKMATVCQALGIEPKGWQAGGRTLEGVPFWTVQETEEKCRFFVDSQRVGVVGKDQRYSHLIFARYPEPTDAWALEAIKVAEVIGIRVELSRRSGLWQIACWQAGRHLGASFGKSLGRLVVSVLSVALKSLTGPSAR